MKWDRILKLRNNSFLDNLAPTRVPRRVSLSHSNGPSTQLQSNHPTRFLSTMPSEPASASLTVLPVLGCLAAAGDYLKIKPPATWTPVNPTQTRFLDLYGSRLSQLDSFFF